MSANALAKLYISEEEYAHGEELSEIKHEWFNGEVFAMAGGTPTHALLCYNAGGALKAALKGKSCRGAGSEQRVRIEASGLFTYPDALVVCPPERYDERDPNSLLNPTVLIEVLSPSTERYDRTDKFDSFKFIASLREYVLISSDRVRVEQFSRTDDGAWTVQIYTLRSEVVNLAAVEIALPLDELYERAELPEGPQPLNAQRNGDANA